MPRPTATQLRVTTTGFNGLAYAGASAVKPYDSAQEILTNIDQFPRLQAEPMGFQVQDDTYTLIQFTDLTATFQIAPVGVSFDVWVQGRRFTKTVAEAVALAPLAEGLWYISYDVTGALVASQTPWNYATQCPVALVYWENVTGAALMFADERHGITMDWSTHRYNHETTRTRFASGLGLTGIINGDGTLDVHAQVDMDPGVLYDEDLRISIVDNAGAGRFYQDLSLPAKIPIFYLDGSTPVWRKYATTSYPVHKGATYAVYNLFTPGAPGSWSQPDATATNYVAMWIFGSNDYNDPIFAILGQRQDPTLPAARANNTLTALSLASLPIDEMKPLYRLIFQTDVYGAPSGINARLRHIEDYRQASSIAGAFAVTSHNSLPGRYEASAHPASAIVVDSSGFTKNLGAGVTDAQLLADAVDQLGRDAVIEAHFSNNGAVLGTGEQTVVKVVPMACTITAVQLYSGDSTVGSIVIDIWKQSYANYKAVNADSITAAAPPTIAAAIKSEDATLTGWTTALAAGDHLVFNIDSVTSLKYCTLVLKVRPT